MINRIRALFAEPRGATALSRTDEVQLAAAALLVEAALMDGSFDASERAEITRVLGERFELSSDEIAALLDDAAQAVHETSQLYGFTKVLKDRFDGDERIRIIEMLWEVAYADGQVDHFESNLIRRIGGLLFVSDRDRGLAKQRVLARRSGTGKTRPS